ncbi:MAG: STAS domain-containing protein [Akkermansia sp.]
MNLDIITQEPNEGHFILAMKGKLDTETYTKLEQTLDLLFLKPVNSITMDLAQLTYISSMGLRVIISTTKKLSRLRAQLIIANASPSITSVLEIAKTLPSMAIFSSTAEADAYLTNIQNSQK